jgi:cytochrome bd ubiquinol oxidase subunit I
MDNLLAARGQMAISLAFHIVFAVAGIAMPLMMVIAEAAWLKSGDSVYRDLAMRWAKGTAILFAVGAVSGTVLSFELGLLWPRFMEWAGPIIGMPFSLEGFAFFAEAIFLGIYLYGWNRVSSVAHLAAGVIVAIGGAASAIFVVIANAWMNTPTGFILLDGRPVSIDPIAAMSNPSAAPQAIHMILAAYAACGFAVAGIHAWLLKRDRQYRLHQYALKIALATGGVAAFLLPFSGDFLAQMVGHRQPVKLAAMEGQFETERGAPIRLGGIPDEENRHTPFALEIPYGLSLLAFHDPSAVVRGLNDFPSEDWPPIAIVHIAFQVMVLSGFLMMAVAVCGFWTWRRRRLFESDRFRRMLIWAAPLGFVALEAGWIVTEVGRQPWIIQGVMRTADAVTPMPGLIVPFLTFTLLYVFLAVVVVWLLFRQFKEAHA